MSFFLSLLLFTALTSSSPALEEQSFIIEIEGNPHEVAEKMETYHPSIEILSIYDTIFNGLAIKADQRTLERIKQHAAFKKTYPVQSYKTQSMINKSVPFLLETEAAAFPFTGKGVKVGIIDTGIDYEHPDLQKNYKGGADLVDFDQDPMETQPEEGIPTSHGTHVAGIIGANGEMKGLAPGAEIYAYRALGPGGMGSSVQVMAAIEKAVKDGMDVINLSLGNTINGPDWPTSVAVNRATEAGVAVVIANGNTGPDLWTVGSPATAQQVIAVGASTPPLQLPYLYDRFHDKKIEIQPIAGSSEWHAERDLPFTYHDKHLSIRDKIILMESDEENLQQQMMEAEQQGAAAVLFIQSEEENTEEILHTTIPAAYITKETGDWLKENANYLEVKQEEITDTITDFSSRGPVTVNWAIKPEIVAPGASIVSTVPGGYEALSGTSMAAPHITGVVALLKEAHPDWTPAQLKAALLTTADPLAHFLPVDQGAGKVNPLQAIETDTLIEESFMQFGKVEQNSRQTSHTLTVENISDQTKEYSFQLPRQQQEIRFQLPKSFTLEPGEKKDIIIKATIRPQQMEGTIRQGYLYLNEIPLPYLFLKEGENSPKAMGFELSITPMETEYHFQLYVAEAAEKLTIDLYEANTFEFVTTLAEIEEPEIGVQEGSFESTSELAGTYIVNIQVMDLEGDTYDYQTMLQLDGSL